MIGAKKLLLDALGRAGGRAIALVALATAIAIGIGVWRLQSPAPARGAPPTVRATRGDLVLTVGGVGRIVEAGAAGQLPAPGATPSGATTAPSTAASAAAPASVSADAVLPRASGRVSRVFVSPGEHVGPGAPLVLLDDGGSAANAVLLARNDLAVAQLELLQKRTSDPLKGVPPTPEELAADRVAVTSARQKLARLLGPPRSADVHAARLDVKRAESDLQALRGGSQIARAQALALAQQNVQLAQERLDKVLAPPNPADVAAAELELRRAEAELAALLRGDVPSSPEALSAAHKAIEVARLRLAQVLAPPNPADVTAARLELARALAELTTLQSGPTPAALAGAGQALAAARARLAQVLGHPLRSDVTAARLEVRKAQADLAVLRARGGPGTPTDIGLARLKVAAARAKLALALFGRRQLTVRAHSAGTVAGVLTVPGAAVDPTTPVATVADLRHLAVTVALSEFDVARVKRGQQAVVSVDALGGQRLRGKVLFEALTGVDNGGVVTFPVQVTLTHAGGVKPGMNVSVRIVVAKRRDVVRVPLEAVSKEGDQPTIAVVDAAGRTVVRHVTLGLANNKDVEIRRGLRPGERVVLPAAQGA